MAILTTENLGFQVRLAPKNHEGSILSSKETPVFSHALHLDVNGEYHLPLPLLHTQKSHFFYDKGEKIAEICFKDERLEISLLTGKQVNIFSDIHAIACAIKAKGPLCIDGEMALATELFVQAESVYFVQSIKAKKANFHIAQGIFFEKGLMSDQLSINAAYVQQSGNISVNQQCDITAQLYQQQKNSQTIVVGVFTLVTKRAEIIGNLTVNGKSFLAGEVFIFGDTIVETTIDFFGENYLHFKKCLVQGDTQFAIRANDLKQISQLIVDNDLMLDAFNSVFDIKNSESTIGCLNNKGEFTLNNSYLSAKKILQRGLFTINRADVTVEEKFFQFENGETELIASHFYGEETTLSNGKFVLKNTKFQGKIGNVIEGIVDVSGKSEFFSGSFFFHEEAFFQIKNSTIKIEKKLILNGQTHLYDSVIKSNNLCAYKKSIHAERSELEVLDSFILANKENISLKSTRIFSKKNLKLFGNIVSEDTRLHAENIEIACGNSAYIYQCRVVSSDLIFQGGEKPDDLCFEKSEFVVKRRVIQLGQMQLVNSSLICIGGKSYCDIRGKIALIKSRILSNGVVEIYENSVLGLANQSVILSKKIHNFNEIDAADSYVFSGDFSQKNASLSIKNTSVKIDGSISSRVSKVDLQFSALTATDLNYDGRLFLDKSCLTTKNKMISSETSQIEGKNSRVIVKKFVALGAVDLLRSLLAADELCVYNKLKASEASTVLIGREFSVSKNTNVVSDESLIDADSVNSLGNITLQSSQLNVRKEANFWRNSVTNLEGRAIIQADNNMLLRGNLAIVSKEVEFFVGEETRKITQTPQVFVKELLMTSPMSQVTGDNLIVNAEHIDHTGSIDLTNSLHAKGTQFNNDGTVHVKENIALGFDDGVWNTGLFSSKNIVVNSNLMNILGGIKASESLSVSGFMSMNLGGIVANNYVNNSLFSFNGGLVLPSFSTDLKYIFSKSNLLSFGKMAASTLLPNYANTINFLPIMPSLIATGKGLYQTYQRYGLDEIKKMRRHEIMPLFCQLKSAVMLGSGALSTAYQGHSEIRNFGADVTSLWRYSTATKKDIWDATATKVQMLNWSSLGQQGLGLLGGNYTDNALIHINTGVSFIQSTMASNFVDINCGLQASRTYMANSRYLYNTGFSVGMDATFLAEKTVNKGILAGINHFTMKSKNVQNDDDALIKGRGVNVSIEALGQQGKLDLSNGTAEIKKYTDSNRAETKLEKMQVIGDTLDLFSRLAAKDVYFHYKNHFKTMAGSSFNADNVTIKTAQFEHAGKLDYQHVVTISAETIKTVKGSEIQGQKTIETELYRVKEEGSINDAPEQKKTSILEAGGAVEQAAENNKTTSQETTEAMPTESTKEFIPQHILQLLGNKVSLGGKQTGGDYTSIKGLPALDADAEVRKCEEFNVEESALVDISHGMVDAKKSHIDGQAKFDKSRLNIDELVIADTPSAKLGMTESLLVGELLQSSGNFAANKSEINAQKTEFTDKASETIKDSTISTGLLIDNSAFFYEGNVSIKTGHYDHDGTIHKSANSFDNEKQENLLHIKAETANLHGEADVDNAYFEIKHFLDGTKFVAGQGIYGKYHFSESLTFSTEDKFYLDDKIQRDCQITTLASEIKFNQNNQIDKDLTLISTVGDVGLTGNVGAKNLYVKSAKNIYMNSTVSASELVYFDAVGGCYNYGGLLNGNIVSVKASEIKNITKGSKLGSGERTYKMGDAGVINGRSKVFLEATKGNIENHGGVIRAGDYAQLIAKGNVLNLCNVGSIKGKYDVIQKYDPALIAGGNGASTEGLGLYIKADGKVYGDASNIISNGDNYIEGIKGVEFKIRYSNYISRKETKKKHLGFKKKHITETKTVIGQNIIHSNNGRNIIRASEGEIISEASQFTSPGGTDIYAKGKVALYSVKTQNTKHTSESSVWGLNKHKKNEVHESATPTLFTDNGKTRIHSLEEDVDARGAYFTGEGDLEIWAGKGKRVLLGRDILNHEVKEETSGFFMSYPGSGAYQQLSHGGSLWNAMTAEDATLAKINSLCRSSNMLESVANASNLGINLLNTTNNLMRGLSNDNLSQELMARYGLGGREGFSPSFGLGYQQTKSTTKYQTLGMGGVNRGGKLSIKADGGLVLENGVRVHADSDVDVDASQITAYAAALNSSHSQTSVGVQAKGKLTGLPVSTGINASQQKTRAKNYENAELSSGGNMKLHHEDKAMDKIELDGANLKSKTLEGDVDLLIIKDKQSTTTTIIKSASVSSSGQGSIYQGKGSAKMTQTHSGIYVQDGINSEGHSFHVKKAYMEGGQVTTDGANNFKPEELIGITLTDEKKYKGVGISGNVMDLKHLTNQAGTTNSVGKNAIPNISSTWDFQRYEAKNKPVVYGEKGTYFETKYQQGEIHTSSNQGCEVIHDETYHVKLNVPILNKAHLDQAKENITQGVEKIKERWMPQKSLESIQLDGEKEKIAEVLSGLSEKAIAKLAGKLQLDSSKLPKNCTHLLIQANAELEKNGFITSVTEKSLQKEMGKALITILKVGGETGWDKVMKLLEKESLAVKMYMGPKGVLFTYAMNLGLANQDSPAEMGKAAAFSTAGDVLFAVSLSRVAGAAAGPVGFVLTGLGVVDNLTYNENYVNNLNSKAIDEMREAQGQIKQGQYYEGGLNAYLAEKEFEAAAQAQAWHWFSQAGNAATTGIASSIKWVWERMPSNSEPQKTPTKAAKTLKNIGIFSNTSSDNNAESQVKKNEVRSVNSTPSK